MTLPALALRFAIEHPAVTSAIIGPRTPGQLGELLATVGPPLDAAVLDRIDAIVAPGYDVDPLDRFDHAPAARDARLRRH
jgi:aryl-alcohol dehydrogenase-like predicted oxidoreductase